MKTDFPLKLSLGLLFLCLSPLSPQTQNTNFDSFKAVERPSPLRGKLAGSATAHVQNNFHNIFQNYKSKIVFVSTEKNVSASRKAFAKGAGPIQRGPPFSKGSPKTRRLRGLGTGFIISRDGYICTNHHVIVGADRVRVRVLDREYPARIVGQDPVTDLALLKVDSVQNFDPVYFGDSSKVRVGDWAIAIGNPFGYDKTFTVGVVSAVRGNQDEVGNSYIQTDASINQGNSGGPLLNIDGEVVGVNRMIFAKSGGGNLGIGFSIPINTARNILEQLYRYGKAKWGFIGVQLAKLTRKLARQFGAKMRRGALIAGVMPGGPAARAGLRRGDIIIRIDNLLIKNAKHFLFAISRTAIGEKAVLKVLRNRKKIELPVIIGERPGVHKKKN